MTSPPLSRPTPLLFLSLPVLVLVSNYIHSHFTMLVLLPLAGGITPATHPASKNSLIPPRRRILVVSAADSNIFPSFIPKQVEKVKDLHAQKMASRMQQLPVQVLLTYICLLIMFICLNVYAFVYKMLITCL